MRRPVGFLITAIAAVTLIGLAGAPAPAYAKRAHALRISVSSHKNLAPGKSGVLTVRVKNVGRRTTRGIGLRARAGKGVSVKPRRRGLKKRLRRGATVRTRLRVKLGRKSKSGRLTLLASGKGARTARRRVRITRKAPGLGGRYFFRTELIGSTSYTYGLYFVNAKWAYRGTPEGGLPSCSSRTAKDADGDGCVPYSYNAKTRAVKVDGKPGGLTAAHVIKVGDSAYEEVAVPSKASRFDAYGNYIQGYGFPPYATFVSIGLKLTPDGQFARSSAVSGSTPDSSFAALPPDSHGTYSVPARGKLHQVFADGHVDDDSIGILYDRSGKPNPNYGLLLDGSLFFGPASDVG